MVLVNTKTWKPGRLRRIAYSGAAVDIDLAWNGSKFGLAIRSAKEMTFQTITSSGKPEGKPHSFSLTVGPTLVVGHPSGFGILGGRNFKPGEHKWGVVHIVDGEAEPRYFDVMDVSGIDLTRVDPYLLWRDGRYHWAARVYSGHLSQGVNLMSLNPMIGRYTTEKCAD